MEALLQQSRSLCPFLQRTSPATLRSLSTGAGASASSGSPGGGTMSNLQVIARRCPVMSKALAVQTSRSRARVVATATAAGKAGFGTAAAAGSGAGAGGAGRCRAGAAALDAVRGGGGGGKRGLHSSRSTGASVGVGEDVYGKGERGEWEFFSS